MKNKMSSTELYQAALDAEDSLVPIATFFGRLRAVVPKDIDKDKINLDFLKANAQKIEELKLSLEVFKKELHRCS